MSQYYNPHRGPKWNYGGQAWKLSRSKIDLFLECPRCFYIDNKLGTKRVPGFPFNINSAIDKLLKAEFDTHRANGDQHPLQKEYGINAKPAPHDKLNDWRENFVGVQHQHQPTGLTVTGAIDDLWINDQDEYIVVDYKATAADEPVTELKDSQSGYKRQMEVYQWLLRQNGLTVSNTGYFVYCTGRQNGPVFDKKIEFDVHVIPYQGNDSWVESTLADIKDCLEDFVLPNSKKDCDHCAYWQARQTYEQD